MYVLSLATPFKATIVYQSVRAGLRERNATGESAQSRVKEFAREVARQVSVSSVLEILNRWFRNQVPDGCLHLWLLNEREHRTYRLLPFLNDVAHAELPAITSAERMATWMTGQESTNDSFHLGPELDGFRCPVAPGKLYLRMLKVGELTLLAAVHVCTDASFDPGANAAVALDHTAHAIRNVVLRVERTIFRRIFNLANRSTGRSSFLRKAVYVIRDLLAGDTCGLFIVDRRRNMLALEAATRLLDTTDTGGVLGPVECEMTEGTIGWVWKHSKPVRLFDINDSAEFLGIDPAGSLKTFAEFADTDTKELSSPRHFLAAPIMLGPKGQKRRLIGIIAVYKNLCDIPFLPLADSIVRGLSEILAGTIEKFDVTSEMEGELQLQRALFDVIEALYSEDETALDPLLEVITTQAQSLFGAYAASVLLKDPDGLHLRVVKDVGPHPRKDEQITMSAEQGLCGYAFRHRETLAVPDVHQDERYYEVLDAVQSELCTPITFRGDVLGVLNVDSDRVGTFRPDDTRTTRTLETFAKQIALALHRREVLAEREGWRRNLLRTVQLLTASSVAAGLAHELKNGLAVISGLADAIHRDPAIRAGRDAPRRLERIREETKTLYSLALRLTDLSRAGEPHKVLTYLNDVVEERVRFLEDFVRARNMKLILQTDPDLSKPAQGKGHSVLMDPRQIGQVLVNLVLNAVDASGDRHQVQVTTKNASQDHVTFSVRDFGCGIKPEVKGHIFEWFYSTKPHGFGLGLPVVKVLVEENHQGKIEISTKEGAGSTFEVRLPKAGLEGPPS